MITTDVEGTNTDLPVAEDFNLHKKGWVVQRIGWVFMFAFVIMALAGLFGEGPLSTRTLNAAGISIKYERFCRNEHEMEMKVQSTGEKITTLSFPLEYLNKFSLEKCVPKAAAETEDAGYVQLRFDAPGINTVVVSFSPSQSGNAEGVIKVNARHFQIKQTIYP